MADQAPDSSIFGSDKSQSPDTQTQSKPADSGDNPLAILVGEGRKYKTADELAKAYLHLDSHTEQVKGENAQLREKLASAKTIDDVLQRLPQADASTPDKGEAKGANSLTANEVAKIVRDTVSGMQTEQGRQANMLRADAAMKKQFGEKAGEVFAKAADTPEKKQALMSLASVDPDRFVQLFIPAQAASGTQTDSGSSTNTLALGDTNASGRVMDPGCKDFYDALRKKDPKRFYSTATQTAMHKAAVANPEKFFGRKLGS